METQSGYRHEFCEYDLSGDTAKIYALFDTRPGKEDLLRYVGVTTKDLPIRLKGHLNEANRKDRYNRRLNWLRSCKKVYKIPKISLLEEVPVEMWEDAERAWIASCRSWGCDLVNSTSGGHGMLHPTPETIERKRRSAMGNKSALGHKLSASAKEKIRQARLRQGADPEKNARLLAGARRAAATEEGQERQRKATEAAKSAEARRKNSEAKKQFCKTSQGVEHIRAITEAAHSPEAIKRSLMSRAKNQRIKKEQDGQIGFNW